MLDGFVMGCGMLHFLLGKTDGEKRVLINTIGPVWDGNEVWLVTAGGATLAGPEATGAEGVGDEQPSTNSAIPAVTAPSAVFLTIPPGSIRPTARGPLYRTIGDYRSIGAPNRITS